MHFFLCAMQSNMLVLQQIHHKLRNKLLAESLDFYFDKSMLKILFINKVKFMKRLRLL
jgi:hypothetical protein